MNASGKEVKRNGNVTEERDIHREAKLDERCIEIVNLLWRI